MRNKKTYLVPVNQSFLAPLAVSAEPLPNMEDTYLQSDKVISTEENQMSRRDEERLADSTGDNNLFNSDSSTSH